MFRLVLSKYYYLQTVILYHVILNICSHFGSTPKIAGRCTTRLRPALIQDWAILKTTCIYFLFQNNFCPTCRSRAVRNNVYVIPSSQDLAVDFLVEYDEDGENVGGGSDVTSLESESEESYIDDEDELEENMWSDQSEEDCVIEDSESEDLSDLIDNSLIEMAEDIVQSDNDLSDLIEMEEESVQSDNGSMEENNEELSEEVMSDDSFFYEAETGSILFSEDDDVDNEQ